MEKEKWDGIMTITAPHNRNIITAIGTSSRQDKALSFFVNTLSPEDDGPLGHFLWTQQSPILGQV